jgi:hypothetical protein
LRFFLFFVFCFFVFFLFSSFVLPLTHFWGPFVISTWTHFYKYLNTHYYNNFPIISPQFDPIFIFPKVIFQPQKSPSNLIHIFSTTALTRPRQDIYSFNITYYPNSELRTIDSTHKSNF